MLRTVMIAALFCLIFYSTPAYASSCEKVAQYVRLYGERAVRAHASSVLGFTADQIAQFVRSCRTRSARR